MANVGPRATCGLAAAVAAFTPASVKLAAWRAALLNESKAAVAAASEDFIAATATSLPAGADLAAWSTVR